MIRSIKFCISRFNLEMPIYVNMVRDPVERVISWYYYIRSVRKLKQHSERKWADLFLRAPWYFVERKRVFPELPLPNPNWLKKVKMKKKLSSQWFFFYFRIMRRVWGPGTRSAAICLGTGETASVITGDRQCSSVVMTSPACKCHYVSFWCLSDRSHVSSSLVRVLSKSWTSFHYQLRTNETWDTGEWKTKDEIQQISLDKGGVLD